MKYQIISDSSCDLPKDIIATNNIEIVPFYVSFDSKSYQKESIELSTREFYQRMVDENNIYPKSSLPSVHDYYECFLSFAKENIPMICICITTKFSGSYNSAITAKDLVMEECPNAKIEVIDSTINTVLQGLFVLEACKMQQLDYSYKETISRLNQIKSSGRIFFTIGSIDYLKQGGRIGKLTGLAASTLGIKPLIVLKEGEIFLNGITRSRKKAKNKLLEQVKEHFSNTTETPDDYTFAVGYGYDKEEAIEFRNQLTNSLSTYSNITDVPIYQIGATIGVHTGPFPIGLGLIKRCNSSTT